MRSAFTGAFAPYICGLIEKKQALGYDYHGSACILRTFDEFCREQFPNETCLTAELAMKWAEQFKTEKNLSRLNRVSVIRELAKYMNSVGEQAYLLPLQLTKKSGRHIPYIYSKEDLSKLFKEIDSLQPSLRAPTKHLVVSVARCQELVDAKIHDLSIRKTHATICLTGKGNKLRIVPISPSVVELLKTYLDKAHPTEQRQSDDYLFFTTHHGRKSRMSTDAVNLFMKKYGEMARRACPEVPERVHPHQLRHSRAMHLYRAGMPLVLLAEFLGHADVNTTRIYAWADTEMKRQAIQKVSKVTEGDTIEPIWANDEELIKRLYGLA